MAGIKTEPIDISKYKCVPLDLLRNVSDQDQVQFQVGANDISLKQFKDDVEDSVRTSGASPRAISAETIENMIVGTVITFSVLLFVLLIYYMGNNVYRQGWGAIFQFSEQARTIPLIGIGFMIVLILGFLIGYFTR